MLRLSFVLAASLAACAGGSLRAKAVKPVEVRAASEVPAARRAAPARGALAAIPSVRVRFATGSYELDPSARGRLERVARALRRTSSVDLVIVGHADPRGADKDNWSLALRRAHAVAGTLSTFGVRRDRLIVVSRGERGPAPERRVDLGLRRGEVRLVPVARPDGRRTS